MRRIVIAGSRWIGAEKEGKRMSDVIGERQLIYEYIRQGLDELDGWVNSKFCVGGAKGVDEVAEAWLRYELKVKPEVMKADWKKFGKQAGIIRNMQMSEWAKGDGGLILIWSGTSPGSKNMKFNAQTDGLKIFERIVTDNSAVANGVKA
jgi:hypothetical protein